MKELEFNTLDKLAESDNLNRLAENAQKAVKEMQVEVPPVIIPDHVVPSIIKKQIEKENKKEGK